MADAESLQNILQNYYAITGAIAAGSALIGGLTGVLLGYAIGRKSQPPQEPISDRTRQTMTEVDKINAGNAIKLKEMEYAEAEKVHRRQMEKDAAEGEFTLKQDEIARQRSLEDRTYSDKKAQERRAHKLELAKQLVELKPAIQIYLEQRAMAEKGAPEYVQAREEYRKALVDEMKKDNTDFEDDNGDEIKEGRFFDGNEIPEEDIANIQILVDAKFPKTVLSELPQPIKELINLVSDKAMDEVEPKEDE